jgi:hypothetical protein
MHNDTQTLAHLDFHTPEIPPARTRPAAASDQPPVPAPLPTPAQAPATSHAQQPTRPQPPRYAAAGGLEIVYWIAIIGGAAGQIAFFGAMFNVGAWGYVAAFVIATTCETIMVTAGDKALQFRADGRTPGQWKPFACIAFLAAATASALNLAHWLGNLPELGVLFGGIAFLGFVLHYMDGYITGTDYLARLAAYQDEQAELAAQREQAAKAAEQERERELARQRAQLNAAVPQASTAPRRPSRKSKSAAGRKPDKDTALDIARRAGATKPAAIKKALIEANYEPPAASTIDRYAAQLREEAAPA